MTRFSFTTEKQIMICRYDPGSRDGLIYQLRHMMEFLPRRKDGTGVAKSLLKKLEQMTDEEYFEVATALAPFYEQEEDYWDWDEEPDFEWSDNPEVDDYDPYDDFN